MSDQQHHIGIETIRTMAGDYGRRISLTDIRIFDEPQGDGSPYVEVDDAYNFVIEERGVEFERRKTGDLDELLYWIFDSKTFSVASDFELYNRKPNEDSRRQLFERQEALLAELSPAWGQRKSEEHLHILERYPFQDDCG